MNTQERKEAVRAYKERKPDMGIIEVHCLPTKDRFAKAVTDTKEINRHTFQLDAGLHPNKELQNLWATYGQGQFQVGVERLLDYKDPSSDHAEELETLLELYFLDHPQSKRI